MLAVGTALIRGIRLTARANTVLVALTLAVLLVVILAGATQVDTDNWSPAMARDRLLPRDVGATHPRFGTPHVITLVTMGVVSLLAGLVPLSTLAELVNIGTLFAFALVAIGVLYLRSADPARHRPFRVPLVPAVPLLAIAGCLYLAFDLPGDTWLRFVAWMAIGLVVYVLYSRGASVVGRRRGGPVP